MKASNKLKCGHTNLDLDCKYCKKLYNKWNDVLIDDGFVDQEKLVNNELELKQFSSNAYQQAPELIRENKQTYYEILLQKVQIEEFDNKADKIIMSRTAEGYKIVEISKELKKIKQSSHVETIRYIIRRYENKWGVKKWKPEQMSNIYRQRTYRTRKKKDGK